MGLCVVGSLPAVRVLVDIANVRAESVLLSGDLLLVGLRLVGLLFVDLLAFGLLWSVDAQAAAEVAGLRDVEAMVVVVDRWLMGLLFVDLLLAGLLFVDPLPVDLLSVDDLPVGVGAQNVGDRW